MAVNAEFHHVCVCCFRAVWSTSLLRRALLLMRSSSTHAMIWASLQCTLTSVSSITDAEVKLDVLEASRRRLSYLLRLCSSERVQCRCLNSLNQSDPQSIFTFLQLKQSRIIFQKKTVSLSLHSLIESSLCCSLKTNVCNVK